MAAQVRFEMRRGFLGQLLRSQEVGEEIMRRTSRVSATARTIAPVRTGRFAGSLGAVVGQHRGRVKGRVYTTHPYGWVIEHRHHTLVRALEAARG